MTGVLIRFQFRADFDANRLRAIAEKARTKFAGMPGLISKTFTIDVEERSAVNFYVWESEQAARDFFTEATLDQVANLYGVLPKLEFLEVAQRAENY